MTDADGVILNDGESLSALNDLPADRFATVRSATKIKHCACVTA